MTRPSGSSDFPAQVPDLGSVARGHRASRSHNKVIVWSTTLSISLDGDQSKQEDSVKRRINQSDRHKFWHKFCINEEGGGGGGELLMDFYFS